MNDKIIVSIDTEKFDAAKTSNWKHYLSIIITNEKKELASLFDF